ncbi:hypothetical protein HDU93_003684 [Gonapodya sp. JEL0774]|nr:hypothetical protein HDU93_003684 [Gonapodya sp. JEL0774]
MDIETDDGNMCLASVAEHEVPSITARGALDPDDHNRFTYYHSTFFDNVGSGAARITQKGDIQSHLSPLLGRSSLGPVPAVGTELSDVETENKATQSDRHISACSDVPSIPQNSSKRQLNPESLGAQSLESLAAKTLTCGDHHPFVLEVHETAIPSDSAQSIFQRDATPKPDGDEENGDIDIEAFNDSEVPNIKSTEAPAAPIKIIDAVQLALTTLGRPSSSAQVLSWITSNMRGFTSTARSYLCRRGRCGTDAHGAALYTSAFDPTATRSVQEEVKVRSRWLHNKCSYEAACLEAVRNLPNRVGTKSQIHAYLIEKLGVKRGAWEALQISRCLKNLGGNPRLYGLRHSGSGTQKEATPALSSPELECDSPSPSPVSTPANKHLTSSILKIDPTGAPPDNKCSVVDMMDSTTNSRIEPIQHVKKIKHHDPAAISEKTPTHSHTRDRPLTLLALPIGVLVELFKYLAPADVARVTATCRQGCTTGSNLDYVYWRAAVKRAGLLKIVEAKCWANYRTWSKIFVTLAGVRNCVECGAFTTIVYDGTFEKLCVGCLNLDHDAELDHPELSDVTDLENYVHPVTLRRDRAVECEICINRLAALEPFAIPTGVSRSVPRSSLERHLNDHERYLKELQKKCDEWEDVDRIETLSEVSTRTNLAIGQTISPIDLSRQQVCEGVEENRLRPNDLSAPLSERSECQEKRSETKNTPRAVNIPTSLPANGFESWIDLARFLLQPGAFNQLAGVLDSDSLSNLRGLLVSWGITGLS